MVSWIKQPNDAVLSYFQVAYGKTSSLYSSQLFDETWKWVCSDSAAPLPTRATLACILADLVGRCLRAVCGKGRSEILDGLSDRRHPIAPLQVIQIGSSQKWVKLHGHVTLHLHLKNSKQFIFTIEWGVSCDSHNSYLCWPVHNGTRVYQ